MKQELEAIKIQLGHMLNREPSESLKRRISNAIYELHLAAQLAEDTQLNQHIETRPSSALGFIAL